MVFKQIRRVKKALDDANIGVGANVDLTPQTGTPEGRVPMGDGWYRTPEVIDPRDPVNYPDSPWNGGNPINSVPFAIDIGISVHPCGFDIDAQGTVAFIMGPISGVSYRHPGECRKEPPPPPSPETNTLPQPDGTKSKATGFEHGWGVDENDMVFCLLGTVVRYDTPGYQMTCEESPITPIPTASAVVGGNLRCGWGRKYQPWSGSQLTADVLFDEIYVTSEVKKEPIKCKNGRMGEIITEVSMRSPQSITYGWSLIDSTTEEYWISKKTLATWRICPIFGAASSCKIINNLTIAPEPHEIIKVCWLTTYGRVNQQCVYGRWGFIKEVYGKTFDLKGTMTYFQRLCLDVLLPVKCSIPPYSKNPPPPDLDDKDCCMECCSQTNQQQEDYSELLKRILKIVTNVENRLGCKDYPFNVPTSLISESEGFISSLLPKPTKRIDNTQQFMRWIFESFEEVIGQWELPIEIKDSDPTTPGEQPQGMKILNISEGIGELAAIGANASINTEVLINMCTRVLYELAAARQTTADTNSKTKALIEFFGFKTKESRDHMEMTFTAGKDRLDETLKESKQPVALTVFDDPKKSYKQDMAALLHAATIIRTVFTKKASGTDVASTTAAIADMIRQTKKNQTKLDGALDKKLEKEFETFCESFERGWMDEINTDPNSPNEPWGEPYANRPKVVKVIKKPKSPAT